MSYAAFIAKEEQNLYNNLKEGMSFVPNKNQVRDIEILSILEKLGYPMNALGTYFYKDVVIGVCEELEKNQEIYNNKIRKITSDLNNSYSDIYLWIASEDKELGCKTFHYFIEKTVEEIDEDKVDPALASKIYGDKKEITYGESALHIAEYYLGTNTYDTSKVYTPTKVKRLANVNKE